MSVLRMIDDEAGSVSDDTRRVLMHMLESRRVVQGPQGIILLDEVIRIGIVEPKLTFVQKVRRFWGRIPRAYAVLMGRE